MDPIFIQIGPLAIRYYGLMYLLAALTVGWLLGKEARRKKISISDDDRWNLVMTSLLGGILGARIYYVVFNWDIYGKDLLEIPAIWHGGLAIHGGIIGGLIVGLWFVRRHRLPFLKLADSVAPGIILGQAFGRIGNFMNGDAHGVPTNMPWGVKFPPGSIAYYDFGPVATHPVMLYELVLNVLIFGFLWSIRKTPRGDGFLFSLYLILYSVDRFFVSFFRADDLYLGDFRAPHVMSVLLVVAFTAIIIQKRLWLPPERKKRK